MHTRPTATSFFIRIESSLDPFIRILALTCFWVPETTLKFAVFGSVVAVTGSAFAVYTQEADWPVMPLYRCAVVQSLEVTSAALMLRFGSKCISIIESTGPAHERGRACHMAPLKDSRVCLRVLKAQNISAHMQ